MSGMNGMTGPDGATPGAAPAPGADGAPPTFRVADGVAVLSDPAGREAEAIGALRTHIMAQHMQKGRRSIALCAPNAGIGCTSLAVNLAVALAQVGTKTLLIDADMRAPRVHHLITPSREVPGLQQALLDETMPFGDAIQADVLPNLSLIYAGGPAFRPQELLARTRFKTLVDLCLRDYDMTIIDTPPANACADPRRIGAVAGYVVMVVGRNRTFTSDARVMSEELRADRASVIGTVLLDD